MANQFGAKIKELRESNHLLQRQIATILNTDSPMLSKIERGERKAKREQVIVFAKILKVQTKDLLALWLADQVVEVLENEEVALKAMELAVQEVKYILKNKR